MLLRYDTNSIIISKRDGSVWSFHLIRPSGVGGIYILEVRCTINSEYVPANGGKIQTLIRQLSG